jgi:predicted nucleic acid-binding Zn ribbon protein
MAPEVGMTRVRRPGGRINDGDWPLRRQRARVASRAPPPKGEPGSISSIIPALMKEIDLDEAVGRERLLAEWTSVVGPDVARHTRPGLLEDGVLTVFVTHSVWLSELQRFHRKRILDRVRAVSGAGRVKDLRFRLDPDIERDAGGRGGPGRRA